MDAVCRLKEGNRRYQIESDGALREELAENGQKPYAVVVCCSDSRVIPEDIFSAGPGELFVIRVAGNVLAEHQLGSIEYAAHHLGCRIVVMLGHTCCGAVAAALELESGHGDGAPEEGHAAGYVTSITDLIRSAIGGERDPDRACRLNVRAGAERIREAFAGAELEVVEAVYDIVTGEVEWL